MSTINSIVTQLNEMADSHSRVLFALKFLTGKGISYHLDKVDHSALKVLITDNFDRSNSEMGVLVITAVIVKQ